MSEQTIEQAIQAVGANGAPRVTPADIEANIASEHYFTARDGRLGALTNEAYVGRERPVEGDADLAPLGLLTFCVLVLRNGFTVTGESACASPENFNAEIGRRIARENAVAKVWPLMGYELRSKLSLIEEAGQPTGSILSFGSRVATYVGTKVVHAVPMTRQAYNDLRGWELPADENGADEGYLVQYADGGAPNVKGFDGYVSWSPQDVFEKSYTLGAPLKTTNFLTRLADEYKQGIDRCQKLRAFMDTEAFRGLPQIEQEDLLAQLPAMEAYVGILLRRLKRLTGDKAE